MRLHLIVNVLDQCKEGVCFPEDESLWSQAELVRIVSLSGIAGNMLPSNYGYEVSARLVAVRSVGTACDRTHTVCALFYVGTSTLCSCFWTT